MNKTVKVQSKGQVSIPTSLRTQAGIVKGDLVEFSYQGGKIVITPKLVINRDGFPNADGEYTPEQRRYIDARLAKADEDIKAGRTHGPFDTADEMITHMKSQMKKETPPKKPKGPR